MNLKEMIYASTMSVLVSNSGCSSLPDLKNPEVRMQWEGKYKGTIEGKKITYKVMKEGCIAWIDFGDSISLIMDKDCDNTADLLNLTQDRTYLLKNGKAKDVDEILEYIQRSLVKPEYKIK